MSPRLGKSFVTKDEVEHTYLSLRQRLKALEDALSGLDISIPGGSRFREYHRALEKLDRLTSSGEAIQLREDDRELLHDVLLECEQILPSITTLIELPEVKGWRGVTERAFGGHVSHLTERDSTPARDAQFELLLAAMLKRGGFNIHFEEPDIQVELPDHTRIGIAAKRVKSQKRISSRIHKGSKQIRGQGIQGLVAVHIAFLTERIMTSPDMDVALETLRSETRDHTQRNLPEFSRKVDLRNTFGLLIFSSKLAHLGEPAQLAAVSSVYLTNFCEETDGRCAILESLEKGLATAVRTWVRQPTTEGS